MTLYIPLEGLPMRNVDAWKQAGIVLRRLIQENYSTQEEFALDFGQELRTVNRWINQGINKIDKVQELADFFQVDFLDFFKES